MTDLADIDRQSLLEIFLAESQEGLTTLEEDLLKLEEDPDDGIVLAEIFRIVHTIKGDASIVGLSGLAAFAHEAENLLDSLRTGAGRADDRVIAVLLEVVDAFRRALLNAEAGIDTPYDADPELSRRLASALMKDPDAETGTGDPESAANGQERGWGSTAGSFGERASSTLRVGVDKLDKLLTLVGEIAVARGRVSQKLEQDDATREEILEEQRDADRLQMELQELVTKLRMVPVGPMARQYRRMIRDLSVAQGKRAQLAVEAGDVELDNSVLQLLRDPLVHMIRNAVDHGLESPSEREAAGKDPTGTIVFRAAHRAGRVQIELTDDGPGLDLEKIRSRAVALGRVSEGEEPAEEELCELLFEPGFSTKEEVSDLSGRGVGMDVVRRNVEALRGTVEIANRSEGGVRLTIGLPLTLAIIEGLLVRVGDETYVVPIDSVVESLDLPEEEEKRAGGRGVANVRDRTLPYVRLRWLFGVDGEPAERENLVVVQLASTQAGIVVDQVFGRTQTVIKPMAKPLLRLPGLSGSAILADGRVALILDVRELLQRQIPVKNWA